MIEISGLAKTTLSKKGILKFINSTTRRLKIKKIELSLAFVDKKSIKKLNNTYRGLAKATDVLSFCYFWHRGSLNGEIIICYNIAQKQAHDSHHSIEREIKKLLVHGILHLIGHDHTKPREAEAMEKLEEKLLK
ncbi:rRNA maturation RNase YbeY [Candidatus Kuenenbacteria bacterium]|nr:rRNA maturation RNase YbeY [Candidatus Kuenenbacteria bacterium]